MKIASIDIGSNTVLLLIAEINNKNEIIPLVNEYRMPRISAGLSETGIISETSITKLFAVLEEYKKIISAYNCDAVIVNGTQALRSAANGNQIREEIKKRFNFDLNIIDGKTEALYSFKGAVSSFAKNKNYLMIDIGGASTEIVHGNYNELFFRKSFPIGVVTGKEKFLTGNPPEKDEKNKFNNKLNSVFAELKNLRKDIENSSVIAVAGTPTTLTALKQGLTEYSETKVEKSLLTKKDLENFIGIFEKLTYNEIKERFNPIINGREDVILAGSLILLHLMNLLNKEEIFVSGRGLRYGAVIDLLQKNRR